MNEYSTDPALLYHYTDWKGLCGILENNSLWATNSKFSNDASETLLFNEKLIEHLKSSQAFKLNGAQVIDEAEFVETALHGMFNGDIYLASFCGEHKHNKPKFKDEADYINNHGLLSQWRGYGQDGGFAIVFDKQKLEELVSLESKKYVYLLPEEPQNKMIYSKVIYSNDGDGFEKELAAKMTPIDDYCRSLSQEVGKGKGAKLSDELINKNPFPYIAYFECMCRYKHLGFKEENEFRIVAILPNAGFQNEYPDRLYKKVAFWGKNGEQVPYIELFESLNEPLPIKRIIVGPHRNKEDRAFVVKAMLQSHGRGGVEVTISDIPYIGSK